LNYYEIIKKGTYTLYRKKGTISLRGCVVEDLSETGGFKSKQYCICLTPKIGKQKVYYIGCENSTELRDWLAKFIYYGAVKGSTSTPRGKEDKVASPRSGEKDSK